MKPCSLCGRPAPTTRHHVVPKCRRRNKMPAEAKENIGTTKNFCRDCHRAVHVIFTEKELAAQYFTVDKLMADPRVQKFVAWIRKKPPTTFFGSTYQRPR